MGIAALVTTLAGFLIGESYVCNKVNRELAPDRCTMGLPLKGK